MGRWLGGYEGGKLGEWGWEKGGGGVECLGAGGGELRRYKPQSAMN